MFRLAVLAVALLAIASLFIGVGHVSWAGLFSGAPSERAMLLLVVSRIPRTLAVLLAGLSLGIAGLIMQMLARNRFVEPSTAGTAESASLGLLVVVLLAPEAPVMVKMLAAAAFALAGTLVFLGILRRIPLRAVLMVPIVGLMLGGIIESVTIFAAYRTNMLQSVTSWMIGDFSGVLEGRYELLWIACLLAIAAYVAADRFTVAGLGEDFATNIGLNHRRIMAIGLSITAMITATVAVTVGMIPFLGLIVPNVVSLFVGDNARRAMPWIAVSGAGFLLVCDMLGRLIRYPYEIPVGTVVGVLGSAIFLYLLLRPQARHG